MAECIECGGELQNGFCECCDKLRECCFPDCGCDGARVCMAESGASEYALKRNVEGMWSGKSSKQRQARIGLVADLLDQSSQSQGDQHNE